MVDYPEKEISFPVHSDIPITVQFIHVCSEERGERALRQAVMLQRSEPPQGTGGERKNERQRGRAERGTGGFQV